MDSGGPEATYIRESHSALMAHIADRKYPLRLRVVTIVIALAGAALGVLIVMTASDASDLFHELLVSRKPIPANSRNWMLAASLGLMMVPFVSMTVPVKLAASFCPALAEYAGRNSILSVRGDEYDTDEKLVEKRGPRQRSDRSGAASGSNRCRATIRSGRIPATGSRPLQMDLAGGHDHFHTG